MAESVPGFLFGGHELDTLAEELLGLLRVFG
jgi:hypothetical protein